MKRMDLKAMEQPVAAQEPFACGSCAGPAASIAGRSDRKTDAICRRADDWRRGSRVSRPRQGAACAAGRAATVDRAGSQPRITWRVELAGAVLGHLNTACVCSPARSKMPVCTPKPVCRKAAPRIGVDGGGWMKEQLPVGSCQLPVTKRHRHPSLATNNWQLATDSMSLIGALNLGSSALAVQQAAIAGHREQHLQCRQCRLHAPGANDSPRPRSADQAPASFVGTGVNLDSHPAADRRCAGGPAPRQHQRQRCRRHDAAVARRRSNRPSTSWADEISRRS